MQIGSAFEDIRHEVSEVLEPFHNIWNGYLGLMSSTAHDIDLIPDSKPFRSVSYRARTQMRDIEKADADKMME